MNIEDLMNEDDSRKGKPAESPLLSLQKDLQLYKDTLQQVARDIRQEGLSDYPVFIAHQHQVSVGEVILDKDELGSEWTIHASTMEEFISKGIIQKDKKDVFLYSYKDPEEFACVFVIIPEGANFVFIPYA